MSEIQRADVGAKRIAIWFILLSLVFGVIIIGCYSYFEDVLFNWLYANIEFLTDNPLTVFFTGLTLVAPLLFFSAYLFFYGYRVSQSERSPPPGYAVVRDTKVVSGLKAKRLGRLIQSMSLLLLLAGAMIPVVLWYIFNSLVVAI